MPTTVSDASVALEEIAYYLGKLVKMSESSAVVDTNQRQRVTIENISLAGNLPVAIRNSSNNVIYDAGGNSTTIYATIPEFWKFVEAARQNYQTSIRSNLQFS